MHSIPEDNRAIRVNWYLRTWDEQVAGKTAFWYGLVSGGALGMIEAGQPAVGIVGMF